MIENDKKNRADAINYDAKQKHILPSTYYFIEKFSSD